MTSYTKRQVNPEALALALNKSAEKNRRLEKEIKELRDKSVAYGRQRVGPSAINDVVADVCIIHTNADNESHSPIEIDFIDHAFDDYAQDTTVVPEDSGRVIRITPYQAMHFGVALLECARVHYCDVLDYDISQIKGA